MRIFIPLLLLLALTLDASAVERSPRKRRQKNRTEAATPEAVKVKDEPQAPVPVVEEETPVKEDAPVEEPAITDLSLGFTPEQTDSLLAEWRERQRHDAYNEFFQDFVLEDSTVVDLTPDSLYAQRLRDLFSPVPLAYNEIVKNYISRYTNNHSQLIGRILGMSKYYFPIIEEELLKADLPIELRAMPIIESALSTTATSRAGAVGLWQFMPSTGKSYGLEINSLVDERRDPIKATKAACRYLKDLYRIFQDWTLAIAAYNCGPGNINKALARSGGKNFWEAYDWLLPETRGYLPSFIGATYAYAYYQQHGIEPVEAPIPLSVDTIHVTRPMHFGQISSTIEDLPIETLRQLNPQYKIDIIPATKKSYALVLPQRHVAQYIAREQEIFAKDSAYLKEYIDPANIEKRRSTPEGVYYKVKSGDTLGAIARRYRVTVGQLQRWNGIKNPRSLRIGQRLRVSNR